MSSGKIIDISPPGGPATEGGPTAQGVAFLLAPLTSVDTLLDSQDSGLTAVRPGFFRADPGPVMRVVTRWEFGVE